MADYSLVDLQQLIGIPNALWSNPDPSRLAAFVDSQEAFFRRILPTTTGTAADQLRRGIEAADWLQAGGLPTGYASVADYYADVATTSYGDPNASYPMAPASPASADAASSEPAGGSTTLLLAGLAAAAAWMWFKRPGGN